MPKTNVKTTQKEKRLKMLGPKIQSSDLNSGNKISNDKYKRKHKNSLLDAAQACKDTKSSCTLKRLQNIDIFKDNPNYCNQELVNLHGKIADLLNQRDDLIRYHSILTGFDTNSLLKNINPKSLESEITELKSIVGTLQRGLSIVLDEHSFIKSLVLDQIKEINNHLEWNLMNEYPKNKYNNPDNQAKHLPSRFKENSGFLQEHINSNQTLFNIFRTSSNFNRLNSNDFLETISQINHVGHSDTNDSMAKFRQLAELKIVIEILQKYSKIVTDEFRHLSSSEEISDQKPLDFQLKTDQQDQTVNSYSGALLPLSGNHLELLNSTDPVSSSLKSGVNNIKTSLEMPQEGLIISLNQYKTGEEAVSEDQLMPSKDVLKFNSSRHVKDVISINRESGKSKDKILFENGSLCKQAVLEMENKCTANNVCTPLNAIGQDTKKSNKRKVLFLSDGHGRYCSQFLQDELGSNFSIISVVKPDALFEEIIKDFLHLASSFTREDYVIIFAGSNNLKCKEKTNSHIELEIVLPILQHTNVIFTRMPLLFDHPSINSQVRRVNSENSRKVFELSRENSNILPMPKFTFFSRDRTKQSFNKIGKKTLCKLLAKTIITHSFGERRKSCIEFKNNHIQKISVTRLLKITSSQPLNCVNESNLPAIVVGSASTKKTDDNKSKWNNFVDTCPLSKCEQDETNQQFKKSAQTQTSEEDVDECFYQIKNEKFFNLNPELHAEARTTSKNFNKKVKSCSQSTMTDQHSSIDPAVGVFHDNFRSEDQGKGFFAGIFMKNNHSNMSTMKELLGQGDIPKPRKNFIQENVKRLKELKLEKTNKLGSQRSKNLQPLTERRNAQTMVSSSRFSQRHSVSGRPASQQSPSPPLRSRRTIKHVTLDTQQPIVEVDESPKGFRSQGCQTLNSKQLEHLYEEGVIRYPSVRDMVRVGEGEGRTVREMALQTETPLEILHPPSQPSYTVPPPLDEGLHWDEETKAGDKDYVKINAMVPDPRRHRTPDLSSKDPTRAPSTYQRGIVPKYLREHKKEMERERINKAKEDECPEGHIQLPEDIKQKHLSTLRQNYAELVSQLNQLPVSTDTLRTRTRKKQIETDLDRIEAAIALFSREKVFVKADS